MKSNLLIFLLLLLISSNVYSSCKATSIGKQITVTGWTPEEAYQKLHLELPRLGVLQTVSLESVKAMSDNKYFEQVALYKTINANIDMIATHHCKINNLYAITVTIPDGSINYYPERINMWLQNRAPDNDDFFVRFWTFQAAKRHCKDKDYSLITINYQHKMELKGGYVVHQHRDLARVTSVVCGSGWEVYLYSDGQYKSANRPYGYFKHAGRKYTQIYADLSGYYPEWSDYMELQMLQNALK